MNQGPQKSFAALRHPGFRAFFITLSLSMMADTIEHVISYWIMYEKFRSPALAGIAILTHWLPSLFFSVYAGALADRFDLRRVIQVGMGMYMLGSFGWGVLFLTDTLEMWNAVVLLTLHGFASVLITPSQQVIIHEIVGRELLQSAVRLSISMRYLGLLLGPVVGGAMMYALGPAWGILVNVLFFLPIMWWLSSVSYGRKAGTNAVNMTQARAQAGGEASGDKPDAKGKSGLADILATMRQIAHNPTIVSMTLLVGGASLFIGNAYTSQMPEFAHDLGHPEPGAYSMLLAADALGAIVAGVVLESRGLLRSSPRLAILFTSLWCLAIGGFAMVSSYPLAVALLASAGFFSLAFNSMAQTLVQIHAPDAIRGRVLGLFNMASLGLRAFSGLTVGVLGALIGIHWSLAASALALLATTIALLGFAIRGADGGRT